MRSGVFVSVLAVVLVLTLFAGCMENGSDASDTVSDSTIQMKSVADARYESGIAEYANGNYQTAADYFEEATTLYTGAGLDDDALLAKKKSFTCIRASGEYELNETEARASLREKADGITDGEISDWLSNSAQTLFSDGQTWYFYDTAANYLYENYHLLQKKDSLDFEYMSRDVLSGRMPNTESPYFNPVYYQGTEKFVIPGDFLTGKGMIRIWFPLPLETESQTDVSVSNLSYAKYIVNGPITEGGIGYVFYEIPAEIIDGDLTITADIGFTSYEQGFYVDPALVLPYNTKDPEYILYTKSDRNIEINDAIKAKALEIVGDETNPYNQAIMIYTHIIETYPYSHVPHLSLDTIVPKTAESTYMLETGHGDCGTQSMFFSAMCRSLGIPARATGGYQMILSEKPGTHFWAEYYIEGYGWIPCDPTVSEASDWVDISDSKRNAFKEYFGHNLDNSRFVIQKDVDAEMLPALPDDAVLFRLVLQTPAVIYDESDVDIALYSGEWFSVDLKAILV
jgi:tetratricopeptide (TPR) repeat protein